MTGSPLAIEDPDDPRIEQFRHIRERDIVGRGGLIAEGTVVVEQLLLSERFTPTALLILANRLAGLKDLLSRVPPQVPVYVASQEVFDRIAGFPVHRGVLAHARLRKDADDGLSHLPATLSRLAGEGGMVVVAVGIANHDNMGAIFRNAAAFGAGMVLVDGSSCDPLYRKAIRVSAGSVLRLPFVRIGSGGAARGLLAAAGFRCLALAPAGRLDLTEVDGGAATALFLGAEGPGLPPDLIGAMETVGIAMAPGFDSLNVATSAAIALHHLRASRFAQGSSEGSVAGRARLP